MMLKTSISSGCLAAFLALSGPALPAETCPAGIDDAHRTAVLNSLADAPSEAIGQQAANEVWAFWMQAPDLQAQALLDDAMARRRSFDLAGAEDLLDELIAYCPTFPEGWNQRAFVRFLRENDDGALQDIDETLAREPAHFGALAGAAQVYFRMGRASLAHNTIRRALRVHPWMAERHMLPAQGQEL